RLALMKRLESLILKLADISEIVPEKQAADEHGHGLRTRITDTDCGAVMAKKRAQKSGKFVYLFGKKTDGNGSMKPLLGGKGANLAEMCRIGLPVPSGFTITTEVCTYYYANKRSYPSTLRGQMDAGVASIEQQT